VLKERKKQRQSKDGLRGSHSLKKA